MKNLSLRYLAGFVDGEGCIFVGAYKDRGYEQSNLRLQVSNAHLPTLKALKKRFGGHIHPGFRKKKKWKQIWILEWSGTKAVSILKKLHPHLSVKRKQARIVGKWKVCSSRKSGLSPSDIKHRKELHLQLKELKKESFEK